MVVKLTKAKKFRVSHPILKNDLFKSLAKLKLSKKIAVAVSGGPDSLALTILLNEYAIQNNIELINVSHYKNIDFIAAGGLSISDITRYKSLGYKAIVIGDMGFKNNKIDPKIYEWLRRRSNGRIFSI